MVSFAFFFFFYQTSFNCEKLLNYLHLKEIT